MPGKSPKLSILTNPFFTYFSPPLVAFWDGPCEAADVCCMGYSCCCSVILKSLGFLLSRTAVSLLSPFKTFSITVPRPRPRVIVLLSSSRNRLFWDLSATFVTSAVACGLVVFSSDPGETLSSSRLPARLCRRFKLRFPPLQSFSVHFLQHSLCSLLVPSLPESTVSLT